MKIAGNFPKIVSILALRMTSIFYRIYKRFFSKTFWVQKMLGTKNFGSKMLLTKQFCVKKSLTEKSCKKNLKSSKKFRVKFFLDLINPGSKEILGSKNKFGLNQSLRPPKFWSNEIGTHIAWVKIRPLKILGPNGLIKIGSVTGNS